MKDMNKCPSELTGITVREYSDSQIGEFLEKHPIKTIKKKKSPRPNKPRRINKKKYGRV